MIYPAIQLELTPGFAHLSLPMVVRATVGVQGFKLSNDVRSRSLVESPGKSYPNWLLLRVSIDNTTPRKKSSKHANSYTTKQPTMNGDSYSSRGGGKSVSDSAVFGSGS